MPTIQDLDATLKVIANEQARLLNEFQAALRSYERRYLTHDAQGHLIPKGRTQLKRLLAYQAIQAILSQPNPSFEAMNEVLNVQIDNIGLNDKNHYRKGLQAAAKTFLDGQATLRKEKIRQLYQKACQDDEALKQALQQSLFYSLLNDTDLGLALRSPRKKILLEHFASMTDPVQLNRKIPHVMDHQAIMINWDKSKTIAEHVNDFKLSQESKREEQEIAVKDDLPEFNPIKVNPLVNPLKDNMQTALEALKKNLGEYPKEAVRSIFKSIHTRQAEIRNLNNKINEWEQNISVTLDEIKLKKIQCEIAEVLMEKLEGSRNWQGHYSHDTCSLHRLVRGPLVTLLGIGQYQDAWLPWADELNAIIKNKIEKLPLEFQFNR